MRAFRLRIFEENGRWFFRWDNVNVPTACGLTLPLATRQEAESEMQGFVKTETPNHPWTVFESDGLKAVTAQVD